MTKIMHRRRIVRIAVFANVITAATQLGANRPLDLRRIISANRN